MHTAQERARLSACGAVGVPFASCHADTRGRDGAMSLPLEEERYKTKARRWDKRSSFEAATPLGVQQRRQISLAGDESAQRLGEGTPICGAAAASHYAKRNKHESTHLLVGNAKLGRTLANTGLWVRETKTTQTQRYGTRDTKRTTTSGQNAPSPGEDQWRGERPLWGKRGSSQRRAQFEETCAHLLSYRLGGAIRIFLAQPECLAAP